LNYSLLPVKLIPRPLLLKREGAKFVQIKEVPLFPREGFRVSSTKLRVLQQAVMKIDIVGIMQAITLSHKENRNTKYTKVTKHTKAWEEKNGSSGMLMGRLPAFWGLFWNADDAD
jgi:hypothetical protein